MHHFMITIPPLFLLTVSLPAAAAFGHEPSLSLCYRGLLLPLPPLKTEF